MPNVVVSQVINGKIDRVWSLVRPFDSIKNWHPDILHATLQDGEEPDQVGAVRKLTTEDGELSERLLALSDHSYQQVYSMEKSPFPIRNYVGKQALHEVTESGTTFMKWSSRFDVDVDHQPEMIELVENVYKSGLVGISNQFN